MDPTLERAGHDYWEWYLRTYPTDATYLADYRYNDRLPRVGAEAIAEQRAALTGILERTRAIDPAGLDDEDGVSRGVLIHHIESEIQFRDHKFYQWAVDQMTGPQVWLLELLNYHPFRNEKDVRDLIARYRDFPRYMDEYAANLRDGVREGRVAPRIAVERVIGQLKELVSRRAERSPLALALKKRPPELKSLDDEVLAAIRDDVLPAYARLMEYLEREYFFKAREEPGVWATQGGDAAYAFRVRYHTTTDLTPDRLHAIGHEELGAILEEMRAIGARTGHDGDAQSFLAKLMRDPSNFWRTRQDILAHFEELLKKAEKALPKAFGRLPKTKCIVKAIEDYRERDSVGAFYYQPPDDLSRPGIFYANTYKPETRPKFNNAALTYHEAVPGHHFQIALSVERRDLPPFRRHGHFTAFVEGWALYAERLADEMGLYADDIERFGMLTYQAWRACRLVVDTGLHWKHWSRQEAIDFFQQNIALGETEIINEVDRYIIWPGQALAYKVGQREIARLREASRKALGPAFDLRAFHDETLRHGALPLRTLEEALARWSKSPVGK